jgi:hypothetical protein
VRDPERAHGRIELLRRSAVPVFGALDAVRVEIPRPGDVILLVLFGNPEIDVEEQELAGRRGLLAPSIEQPAQPFGVDELVVVRKTFDRQGLIGCPRGPTVLVSPDARAAQLRQPGLHRRDVLETIAVEDDLTIGENALRVEQPFELRIVDAAEPTVREGDGPRDVTPSSLSARPPAVVRGERPDIDDRELRLGHSPAELGCGSYLFGNRHVKRLISHSHAAAVRTDPVSP